MINKNRVVPVKATDLISLYGTMLKLVLSKHSASYTVLDADDVEGHFTIPDDAGNYLLSQPAKKISFAGETAVVNVYFVPDYGFEGFNADVNETYSVAVDPESAGLYLAGRNVDHGEPEDVIVSRITPAAN